MVRTDESRAVKSSNFFLDCCIIISKSIVAIELSLLPLLLAAFIVWPTVFKVGGILDLSLPSIESVPFLQWQSAALQARGVNGEVIGIEFRLFAAFVWLSVATAMLRLLSGPFLFSVITSRMANRRPVASIERLVLGWACAGPLAMFAASYGLTAAPVFNLLLKTSPRAFIRFETFMFVGAIIISLEGVLAAVRVLATRARNANDAS